jgi:hypothetical protein
MMQHCTFRHKESEPEGASPVCQEEFDVLITGSRIIFSWNSKDISEIAHTLGEPDIDLEPCG